MFKVLACQYSRILLNINLFENQKEVVDALLFKIKLSYQLPEDTVIKQYDPSNKHVYFTGIGSLNVFKLLNSRQKIFLATL